jgi:streptogramin lyase
MHMTRALSLGLFAALAAPALAQDSYWIANRASMDLMEVTAWGSVVQRVPMGTALRSAHRAPDGKIWVVRFIQATFDIFDPATGLITNVSSTLGSPYDIAFDNQGNAWVSGGTGVQQFSANGTFIQSFPLTQAAPLGITIDANDNKWIAHRTAPGSVTRIDSAGTVTNYSISPGTTQAVRPVADFRGLGNASHIWLTGDPAAGGVGELVELDELGAVVGVYPMPNSSLGGIGPVFDLNGDIWVGSFGNGSLFQVDETTGLVLNTYTLSPSINGLGLDHFGRIWATARITFSGVGPPCEVRRVDPATGTFETTAILEVAGANAAGTQSALSTMWQYSMVVAPLGDLDGDGVPNLFEIQGGTSPTDPCSNNLVSVNTTGVTFLGGAASIDVAAGVGTFWLLAFADGRLAAGSGITLPGFGCEMLLNPANATGGTVSGLGPASLGLTIPSLPVYQGYELFIQGFAAAPGQLAFTNLTGLKIR